MRLPRRRSDCPISSALDLLGDQWSLLVMRDVLLRGKAHYREFLASEEHIATNILADRLSRLEAAGLLERDSGEPRSGKQAYHATAKGKDLVPLLLQMMAWSAAHDPQAAVPGPLLAAITADLPATARAIRELGGIEPFLAAPPAAALDPGPAPAAAPPVDICLSRLPSQVGCGVPAQPLPSAGMICGRSTVVRMPGAAAHT